MQATAHTDLLAARRAEIARKDATRARAIPSFVAAATAIGADYSLPIHTAEQLAVALHAIGGHDRYVPADAVEVLGPLVGRAMAVDVEQFTGGPAIYFTVAPWSHQRLDARGSAEEQHQNYSLAVRRAYAEEFIAAGRALHADEISATQFNAEVVWNATGEDPYRLRLWWD